MKYCIVVVLLLLLSAASFAQPPDTLWTHMLGGSHTTNGWGITVAFDGSVYVAGQQDGNAGVIYKLNPVGDTLWSYRSLGAEQRLFYAVTATSDGGCIATGRAVLDGVFTLLLAKLRPEGTAAWATTFGSDYEVGYAVLQTPDSGFMVAGSSRPGGGDMAAYLLKVNAAGGQQWSRTYASGGFNQYARSLRPAANSDGYILAGVAEYIGQTQHDALLIRTNTTGDTLWRRLYNFGPYTEAYSALQTADGEFAVAGWGQFPTFNNDVLLFKVTSGGTLDWMHHYGQAPIDIGWSMDQTQDGGFVLAGYSRTSDADPMLIHVTATGDSTWMESFPRTGDGEFKSVVVAPDGGIVAVGYSYIGSATNNAYVVKLAVPSGVHGTVHDLQGQPVIGAFISAVGQPYWAVSGAQGNYTFALLPGNYDIISYGRCTGRDTVRNITVLQDSISALDLTVGRTHGIVEQTSLNPIVHNHIAGFDTLQIRNTGDGVMDYSVVCSMIQPATNWLSVLPASGSIFPDSSVSVVVRIQADTTNDGVYDYFGRLNVHMNSCPDSLRNVVVLAVVEDAGNRPDALLTTFSLSASPNPFNPTTTLTFDLPQAGIIRLAVFDITGREVSCLSAGSLAAGVHRASFDGTALSSGLYFARLTSNHGAITRKLLLIR